MAKPLQFLLLAVGVLALLAVGGENSTSQPLASAELYDPAMDAWSSAGSLATAREYQ